MPELVSPSTCRHTAWLDAHSEWGPGTHEDGFGLTPADEVYTAPGFARWVTRLTSDDEVTYRWIIDRDTLCGGIALRRQCNSFTHRAGHIGFGIRPSARGRGLATWTLRQTLQHAEQAGLARVLLVCNATNTASAHTIERVGGRFDEFASSPDGLLRRYWIDLVPKSGD